MAQNNPFAPFVLSEFEDNFEVLLFNFEDYYDLFEEYGYSGNGHSWGSLVKFILSKEDPKLLRVIDIDPEGDTFVAVAFSKEDQRKLGRILSTIANDTERLEHYLSTVPPEEMED